jgi:hypothetical protein
MPDMGNGVERESGCPGRDDGHALSPLLPETLAGPGAEAGQVIAEFIVLHREFPAWAVWLPYRGRSWTAVRPASARVPGPDLPMVWVHAATAAELADRMRGVDGQLTGRDRWP